MNQKLLFIQPSCYDDNGVVIKKRTLHFVGLAFPLLAALTPADWEVEVCIELIEDVPFDTDADVIGIGGMGQSTRRGIDIAKAFKQRGKTVIMGGPMVTIAPHLAAPYHRPAVNRLGRAVAAVAAIAGDATDETGV